jgi:AcrR family transcriptional regulator
MTPARRLTRTERKQATCARLLESAARVFGRRGFHAASVEDVAEDAGFSKGAVYSNFAGKEDLFLALLDRHFERRLTEVRAALAEPGSPADQARRTGVEFVRALSADPAWMPLFMEFWAHAQRNPAARRRLVARLRALRAAVAEILAERAHELGVELPVPAAELAVMTFAMASGAALERALEPAAVTEDLYGSMLEIFFLGVRALANDRDAVLA